MSKAEKDTLTDKAIKSGKGAHMRLSRFLSGFFMPLNAGKFLLKTRGLKRWAILPFILNLVLYCLACAGFVWLIASWDFAGFAWDFWGGLGAWLAGAVNWSLVALKWIFLLPVMFLAVYFSFTAVGMVLASPLNDILSEKVEAALGRSDWAEMSLELTARGVWVSLHDSVAVLLRQIPLTLLALPFLLVPGVGFLPLMLVGAWFTGRGFIAVATARNFLRSKHVKPFAKEYFWQILGLGLFMQLMFMVPVAGLLLLPLGVTAATLMYCDYDWVASLEKSGIEVPAEFSPPARAAVT